MRKPSASLDSDEAALMAAILSAPDDDLPRLVYADWLDEHPSSVKCWACGGRRFQDVEPPADGRPGPWLYGKTCGTCDGTGELPDNRRERAEFIRLQVELARRHARQPSLPGPCECGTWLCKETCSSGDLRRRERALWAASRLNGAPHPWFGNGGRVAGVQSNALHLSHHDEPVVTVAFGGPKVELRLVRGFIGEASGPLHAFWGPPCPDDDEHESPCPWCGGSGRMDAPTPKWAALAAAEPVARVRVTDREPLRVSDQFFAWTGVPPGEHTRVRHGLSYALWDRLVLDYDSELPAKGVYRSEDLARAALSDALLSASRDSR